MNRWRERGHALTETLVVAAVSVPLLLLIPVIGKLQDIRHATLLASRGLAFEATVAPGSEGPTRPHEALADELRARHFAATAGDVRSGAGIAAGGQPSHPLWTDPRGNPWLRQPRDVRVGWGAGLSTRFQDGFSPASDGALFNRVPGARAESLGLQARGVLSGEVEVPLARLPAGVAAWGPLDRLDLTLRARTSLLVNGWAATSPGEVESRLSAVAAGPAGLASALGRVGGLGIEALELGRVPAPRIGELEAWRDLVPADRLRETPP